MEGVRAYPLPTLERGRKMKIKKMLVPLALLTLSSCGLAPVNRLTPTTTTAVSTTVSAGSKIARIAQEIAYDNYMKGNYTSLDFKYDIQFVASVGASIEYYTITIESDSKKEKFYVKVDSDGYTIQRKEYLR